MMQKNTVPQPEKKTEKPNTVKKKYAGLPLKKRILPTVLLSFVAPFTVLVFGVYDIYIHNRAEFQFALWDFFLWDILFAIGIAAVLTAVMLPLRGRAFDIVYTVIFWISLMLFLQGSYLNFGVTSLIGDGVGEMGIQNHILIIDSLIWIAVGGALLITMILIKRKKREILRMICLILTVTMLGMQLISCGVTAMTEGSSDTEAETETAASTVPDTTENMGTAATTEKQTETTAKAETEAEIPAEKPDKHGFFLTKEHLNEVSSGKNIIYFIVDRYDWEYYKRAKEKCPEIFYNLEDGFTYFPDAISLFPRTYPSIAYMITGVPNDFTVGREAYFKKAYTDSPFLSTLKENNFKVNLYTDSYYAYEGYDYMRTYADNMSGNQGYTIDSKPELALDMASLSLFRYLPHVAKPLLGNVNTPQFNKHVIYDTDYPVYSTDMKDIYEYFTENPLQVVNDGKDNYAFIHLSGTHLPTPYDENFGPSDDKTKWDAIAALKQSFKIINLYIDQMKELGVYEDATIIITGDHSSIGSDTEVPLKWAHVTSTFVKPAGVTGGGLRTSNAEICHGDLFATMLQSAGIETDAFGRSVFDIPEDEVRERTYYFQSLQSENGRAHHEQVEFKIVGDANNYDNWTIVKRYYLDENIYD